MSENKYLFKKFIGFSIGPLFGAMINAIITPIIAYFITPDQFGIVGLFTTAQLILVSIAYLGLDQSYSYEFYAAKDRNTLLHNCMLLSLFAALLFSSVLLLFPSQFGSLLLNGEKQLFPIYMLAFSIPISVIERYILVSLRMQEKAYEYSMFNLLSKILVFVCVITSLFVFKRNFITIISATVLGQYISDIILIIIYRKSLKFSRNFIDFHLQKKMLLFGIPLLGVMIIGLALNSMDKIMLKILSSNTELGIYTVALKIVSIITLLQSIFTTFWLPVAYRWKDEQVDQLKFNKIQKLVLLGMGNVFLLVILCREVILLMFNSLYDNIIYIFPFLMFQPILYTLNEVTGIGIRFSGNSYYSTISSIFALLANLILNNLLIPPLGAKGAALATGISYFVLFTFNSIVSQRLWKKFPVRKMFFNVIFLIMIAVANTFLLNSIYIYVITIISILLFNVYNGRDVVMLFQLGRSFIKKDVNHINL